MNQMTIFVNTNGHIDENWHSFMLMRQALTVESELQLFTPGAWGEEWALNPFSPVFQTGADPSSAAPRHSVPSIVMRAGRHKYNINHIINNRKIGVTECHMQQQLGGSRHERSLCLRM